MEEADLFKMSGASAGTIAIVLLVYKIGKSIVGKRLISNCCGRKVEVGLDVKEATTPVETKIEIKNPLRVEDVQEHSQQRVYRSELREDGRDEHQLRPLQVPSQQEGSSRAQGNGGGMPDDA